MTFLANTIPSPVDQRDIPFVPRNGTVIADALDLMPDVFEVSVYNREPGFLTPRTDFFYRKLDVHGLCSTFDTAKGVGLAGRLADKGRRRKGWHWSIPLAIFAVLAGFLITSPYTTSIVANNVRKGTAGLNPGQGKTNAAPIVATAPPPAPPVPPPAPFQPLPGEPNAFQHVTTNGNRLVLGPAPQEIQPLRVAAFVRKEKECILLMSDGTRYTVSEGRLTIVGQLAIADGKVFRLPNL